MNKDSKTKENTTIDVNDKFAGPDVFVFKFTNPFTKEPEPTPEPILKAKRIRVSSWLNVRTTPVALSDNSNKIGELYDGAVVYIFEEKDEWSRIGENMWISSNFFVEN